MKSCIVGSLLETVGLKSTDDVAGTLKECRVKRNNEDLQKVMRKIEVTLNPFQPDQNLHCLTTGNQSSKETCHNFLSCMSIGKNLENDFTTCYFDLLRFEGPIPRKKIILLFRCSKYQSNNRNRNLVELKGTRDLFGRLLYISIKHNMYLHRVFAYPLVPIPFSLGHFHKTDKSVLMRRFDHVCLWTFADRCYVC